MDKWINCRQCGHEYSSKLSRCPNCSCVTVNFNLFFSIIVCLAVVTVAVIAVVLAFGDKSQKSSESSLNTNTHVSSIKQDSVAENEESTVSSENSSTSKLKETIVSSKAPQRVSSAAAASSKAEKPQDAASSSAPTDKYKVGTELFDDNYYITVPLNFLRTVYNSFGLEKQGINFDEFAYSLSDEDKAAGFSLCIKNADGSATKMISYKGYEKFIADYMVKTMKFVIEIQKLDFIDDIDHSNDFDAFGVVVNKNKKDLTDSEYAQIILLGITGAEKQYYSVNSKNTCTLTVVYSNKEKEILKFPQVLFE